MRLLQFSLTAKGNAYKSVMTALDDFTGNVWCRLETSANSLFREIMCELDFHDDLQLCRVFWGRSQCLSFLFGKAVKRKNTDD